MAKRAGRQGGGNKGVSCLAAKLNKHITSPLHSYGSSSSNEAVIKLLARERNREGERERCQRAEEVGKRGGESRGSVLGS